MTQLWNPRPDSTVETVRAEVVPPVELPPVELPLPGERLTLPARPARRVPWVVLVMVFVPMIVGFGSYAGAMLGIGRREAGLLALLLLLLTLFILAAVWHEWKGPSAQKEQPRDH